MPVDSKRAGNQRLDLWWTPWWKGSSTFRRNVGWRKRRKRQLKRETCLLPVTLYISHIQDRIGMSRPQAQRLIDGIVNFHVASSTRCSHQKPDERQKSSHSYFTFSGLFNRFCNHVDRVFWSARAADIYIHSLAYPASLELSILAQMRSVSMGSSRGLVELTWSMRESQGAPVSVARPSMARPACRAK